MSEKRYVANISVFVYADNDEKAIEKSKKLAKTLKDVDDNYATVIMVAEEDFGGLERRVIYEGY